MKYLLLLIALTNIINAQNFSKQKLLGSWELSAAKVNQTIAFVHYIGKKRNEVLTLLFNPQGQMKVVNTGEIYNYETPKGALQIYETKVYRGDYVVKRKNHYDLFKIIGTVEGCYRVKLIEKKIPGYNPHRDMKMCKISNLPEPTYQESVSKYLTDTTFYAHSNLRY